MKTATKIILSALVLLAVFLWTSLAQGPESSGVGIYYFDVGQGDASLIQKGEYQVLIDGGPSDEILSKLGEAMPLTDRNIEMVVLTHPHADHIVGLNQVLERYSIGKIYSTGVVHTSNEYLEFLEVVREKGIELVVPNIGYEIEPFSDSNIQFLWPGERYSGESLENLNNSSEVVRFCHLDECSLFMGDLETDGQAEMLGILDQKSLDIESKYLKVAHHGSSNGTNQRLIDIVKPATAIISVGADNQFGHPHGSIVDLIISNGIELKRTDQEGDVKIEL